MPLPRLSRRGFGSGVAIGGMDRLITIQTRAGTNAYGQPGGTWSNFAANVWAKIEHISGKEVVNQTEFAANVTDRFTCPYVSGVTPKMRILYVDIDCKLRFFDILFPQNVEQRGIFLELLAKEIYSNTSSASGGGGSGTVTRYSLTPNPDGTTVVFTAPVNISPNALVVRNGLILTAGDDYSYSGTRITFFVAPAADDVLALYQ